MPKRSGSKTLYDAYWFPGFTPVKELRGVFGDRFARVIRLNRRSKKRSAVPAGLNIAAGMTSGGARSVTSLAAIIGFTSKWISAESTAGSAEA